MFTWSTHTWTKFMERGSWHPRTSRGNATDTLEPARGNAKVTPKPKLLRKEEIIMHHLLGLPTQSSPKIEAARRAWAVASIKWYSHIPWSSIFRSFSVIWLSCSSFTALNSHWSFEVNITKGQHWSSHFLPSCPPPACLYSVHYFMESHGLKNIILIYCYC